MSSSVQELHNVANHLCRKINTVLIHEQYPVYYSSRTTEGGMPCENYNSSTMSDTNYKFLWNIEDMMETMNMDEKRGASKIVSELSNYLWKMLHYNDMSIHKHALLQFMNELTEVALFASLKPSSDANTQELYGDTYH